MHQGGALNRGGAGTGRAACGVEGLWAWCLWGARSGGGRHVPATPRFHQAGTAASHPCPLQVWSLAASKCIATLEGHRGPIRKLEIVGGRLFSGWEDMHSQRECVPP